MRQQGVGKLTLCSSVQKTTKGAQRVCRDGGSAEHVAGIDQL